MKWYEIQARGDYVAPTEILIYGDIGASWDAESVTAKKFVEDLQAVKARAITVRINSFGGSVPDGVAIFNALRRHGAKITTEVDGVAVSIASLLAMAGDTRRMAANAMLMIHAPWAASAGNAGNFREMAALLDKHAEVMADAYAMGGMPRAEALALLQDGQDHWYTAAEALAAGLIDEITPALQVAAALPAGRFSLPSPKRSEPIMTATTTPQIPPQASQQDAIAARNKQVRTIFASFLDRPGFREMQDSFIDAGTPLEEIRTQVLAKLGQGCEPLGAGLLPESYIDTHDRRPQDFMSAARDSLLIRNGLRVPNADPRAADLARMGVVEMAERIMSMHGRSTRGMSRSEILAAVTHGTSDFTELLANTAGKALRQGYENEPATHVLWTAEREVKDFKTQSLVALSAAPDLLEVKEGAEYTYGTFGESAETFSVRTYGRLFSVTRQALINDDLSAFTRMPAAFGSSARRLEADLTYAKLTGNAAMADGVALFHASHGNLAGAGAALSLASLAAARAAMRAQKGIGSIGYIDPQPRFLLVPTALETTAEQLIASLVDPSKSNDTGNVAWVRGLTPVADPRLDANSTTAWYLAASPSQIDTIVRAYLMGEQRPYYEENPSFEKDGMAVKSRIDVGVGVIDYRGLYKNAGA